MQLNTKNASANCRRGVTLIELVVAAVVMVTVMSFATTLCFRTSLVWKDIGHHRVAVAELSNHLDRLTRLDPQQVQVALQSLKPSELSKRTLHDPQLSGELVQTDIGPQIVLQLNWTRRDPGKPVELVGWIPASRETRGNAE